MKNLIFICLVFSPFSLMAGGNSGLFHFDYSQNYEAYEATVLADVANLSLVERAKNRIIKQNVGVENLDEVRLFRDLTDDFGGRHLRFYRYFRGLKIADMEIIVHFDKSGKITAMNGDSSPFSPDLTAFLANYQGLNLTKNQVVEFIADDNKVLVKQLKIKSNQALISQTSPHIFWQVVVVILPKKQQFIYKISDEASPQTLSKQLNIRY